MLKGERVLLRSPVFHAFLSLLMNTAWQSSCQTSQRYGCASFAQVTERPLGGTICC
jgi:hypothetical protein